MSLECGVKKNIFRDISVEEGFIREANYRGMAAEVREWTVGLSVLIRKLKNHQVACRKCRRARVKESTNAPS